MERVSDPSSSQRLKTGLPEVGPWARDKLDALARYLEFYTKVLKNQPWRTLYLDAYAGGGRAVVRTGERPPPRGADLFSDAPPIDTEVRELIDGSPRIALGLADPFDRYILVDSDPERVAELQALKAEFGDRRTINVLKATAAEGINWVTRQTISRKTHRGIAFLDPFGANLDWASVQKLAATGLFEVVVNFALSMAIQRMLPNSGEVPDAWRSRSTRISATAHGSTPSMSVAAACSPQAASKSGPTIPSACWRFIGAGCGLLSAMSRRHG